ncbi:hypothetical protein DIPPA_15851 [Diplonema papillatum]|nr:hypothetical protein DIPPA_15851 [Diplonema papillatum]
MDPRVVEQQFRDTVDVMLPGETVELAFKCGRDTTVLTNKRLLHVDVQGLTGKQVAYLTLLWSSVSAFAVESAGGWIDRDAMLLLYTNLPGMECFRLDLRKSAADVMSIQRFFSDKLPGAETLAPAPISDRMYGIADQSNTMVDIFTGDSRQIDAAAANHKFHTNPPILQNCETVEMAFKCGRDLTLFTTKRFITVDVRGFTGNRCLYQSIPWATVKCFAICTAGVLDRDAELKLWTDIYFDPPSGDSTLPCPGMSFLQQDFRQNNCDLTMMLRCISARVLKLPSGLPVCPAGEPLSPELLLPTPPDRVSNISAAGSWFTNDKFEVDPVAVNERFHNGVSFMLPNEFVVKAYMCGRDMNVFTNMRVMIVDKKGWTRKSVEYRSFPYSSIKSFSMTTAGSWDLDSEITVDLCNHWDMATVKIDLRNGRADPVALNNFLALYVIGACNSGADGGNPRRLHPTGSGIAPPGAFLSWLEGSNYEVPLDEAERQLQTSPPLLLPDGKWIWCGCTTHARILFRGFVLPLLCTQQHEW